MKKIYLIALMMLFAPVVAAQEPEVPLFDDTTPNLGRNAKPLDSIVLTPAPLPPIRVSLNNEKKPAPVSQSTPPAKVSDPLSTPGARTVPITIDRDVSDATAADLAARLQAEIARTRAEKESKPEQVENAGQPSVASDVVEVPPQKTAETPDLEGLFAKIHDVYTFDIAGFMLGMTPDEIADAAEEAGYRVTKVERGIPLFRTSFYEQNCRDARVYRPEQIRRCIINQALSDEVYYVSSLTLSRKATKEYVQILFTSPATDNVAYKIYYENKGDNSLNFTRRNLAKKLRRKEAFWNLMFETYGLPDDSEKLIWGDPDKAYMQAMMQGSNYNAYIVMEDKDLFDRDYFDAEDQAKDLQYRHSFTFAPAEE